MSRTAVAAYALTFLTAFSATCIALRPLPERDEAQSLEPPKTPSRAHPAVAHAVPRTPQHTSPPAPLAEDAEVENWNAQHAIDWGEIRVALAQLFASKRDHLRTCVHLDSTRRIRIRFDFQVDFDPGRIRASQGRVLSVSFEDDSRVPNAIRDCMVQVLAGEHVIETPHTADSLTSFSDRVEDEVTLGPPRALQASWRRCPAGLRVIDVLLLDARNSPIDFRQIECHEFGHEWHDISPGVWTVRAIGSASNTAVYASEGRATLASDKTFAEVILEFSSVAESKLYWNSDRCLPKSTVNVELSDELGRTVSESVPCERGSVQRLLTPGIWKVRVITLECEIESIVSVPPRGGTLYRVEHC